MAKKEPDWQLGFHGRGQFATTPLAFRLATFMGVSIAEEPFLSSEPKTYVLSASSSIAGTLAREMLGVSPALGDVIAGIRRS